MTSPVPICDLPHANRTTLCGRTDFVVGNTIIIRLELWDDERAAPATIETKRYLVTQSGTYWTALAVPIEDPVEKRKDAIWQAVRDVAIGGDGPE